MKNVLKLSLAVLAAATLVACGGGGSSDVADTYVGSWKSKCFSFVATNGNTYYKTMIATVSKASATEVQLTHDSAIAYTDSGCSNVAGNSNAPNAWKLNIGAKTTFLGAAADAMVWTDPASGEARPGWMTSDGLKFSLVVVNADGSPPNSWSIGSPYTKQ